MKPARTIDLGRREYRQVWTLQQELVAQRQRGEIEDTLVLVEHPDVITLGRRLSAPANVVAPGDIPVVEIERGGDVTYHGPGQLVGYPILALDGDERDLHAYLRNLEEALIGVCADVGLAGGRKAGWTGVWIGERKVAS
ncbi:MAG TPA: lipoyl(octanoyl) transferase LipB, partial [Polyangiaceae bacterium]|nr:lipoyl(octanoyl) transferase LipB [Polyangiaceae bacterium]